MFENSTFDKKDSNDSDILNHKQEVYNVVYTKPEENIWQTVPSKSKRQKRKPKEKEEKPKETKKPKPKKVVEQKSEEQILKGIPQNAQFQTVIFFSKF